MERTYLFYDIETTGLSKCFDQVVQFAAIRTDSYLNEVERYEYFIRLNRDVIPSPSAFITHRISPSKLESGLNEFEAMGKIHALFNTPGTVSIGYNSLGFDDEFLRFSFYRNLLPPYTHQYANHCSRMDLYPITVMYFLYRNSIIHWPEDNLKLENIVKKNNLVSGMAHNAMVDVKATLTLAQCFRQDAKTWEYLTGFFDKQTDLTRCQQVAAMSKDACLGIMVDGKFGHAQQYQALAMPLGIHHHYKNQYLWLRVDTDSLLQATVKEFLNHTWVVNKKIGEPAWVLPMKERFLNSYLREKQANINAAICYLQDNQSLYQAISSHYLNYTYPPIQHIDVDAALYEKNFPSWQDQEVCRKIHLTAPENKIKFLPALSEKHLQDMLVRIIGRHYCESLTDSATESLQHYLDYLENDCREDNYFDYKGSKRLTLKEAHQEIEALHLQPIDEEQRKILQEVKYFLLNNFKYRAEGLG